ncbi:uncharacterized protein K452DRAFT_312176 [Aplosporella prunicola CBS 121167]|uniref:RNase H type-1 domain-containing protein n=1 Tax=Aplosporella prunicola CBS 121167 TaxID=1176127 RepID=A0A6A6B3H0_9PEZI|nr:uncharacterized protein K452DRAFT_312176 [Aplosporella prunicola CBS 121167]KAF2137805.1 hypothetical protein K452DRAFT_312176 [Aplosporella prunicola CBS 121167]
MVQNFSLRHCIPFSRLFPIKPVLRSLGPLGSSLYTIYDCKVFKRHLEGLSTGLGNHITRRQNRKSVILKHLPSPSSTPISIAENATSAIADHDDIAKSLSTPLLVYSDGSLVNKKLAAAAVAPSIDITSQACLDRKSGFTANTAELVAIWMAVDIATQAKHQEAVVFTDSQAALHMIRDTKRASKDDIVRLVTRSLADAHSTGLNIRLQWVPAHKGILGNTKADKLAKKAAKSQPKSL